MNRRAKKFRLFDNSALFFLNLILLACECLNFCNPVSAQTNFPDEIRGYKVYRAKISVNPDKNSDNRQDSDAVVKFGDPQPVSVSISGIIFEIPVEVSNLQQSGKIEFLTFENFRVNDLPVEIEEYRESFDIAKNKIIKLPKPVVINLGFTQALRGVWRERQSSKEFWQVSGRVFVFGRFKKGFFSFKRVVPVDVSLQIKNPLKQMIAAPENNQ